MAVGEVVVAEDEVELAVGNVVKTMLTVGNVVVATG
jgi:hypothetical protein